MDTLPQDPSFYRDHSGLCVTVVEEAHCYCVAKAGFSTTVEFQNGPVPVHGVNGLSNEVLLAILIDRTSSLNQKFPCTENEHAIAHMKSALVALETRTANRVSRGVEGKHVL